MAEQQSDHQEYPSDNPRIDLRLFLRERRLVLGKTMRDTGIASGHLSQIESGAIGSVSAVNLVKLIRICEISLTEILEAGVIIDEELVAKARAIVVGEAVLSLPEELLPPIIEFLNIEDSY